MRGSECVREGWTKLETCTWLMHNRVQIDIVHRWGALKAHLLWWTALFAYLLFTLTRHRPLWGLELEETLATTRRLLDYVICTPSTIATFSIPWDNACVSNCWMLNNRAIGGANQIWFPPLSIANKGEMRSLLWRQLHRECDKLIDWIDNWQRNVYKSIICNTQCCPFLCTVSHHLAALSSRLTRHDLVHQSLLPSLFQCYWNYPHFRVQSCEP